MSAETQNESTTAPSNVEEAPASAPPSVARPPLPSLSAEEEDSLLHALASDEERVRFQALLTLGELKKDAEKHGPVDLSRLVSERLFRGVEALLNDPSRQVREQVRHLGPFTVAARAARSQEEAPSLSPGEDSPPRPMMALVSFGSAATGVLATALSLMHYYALGNFPYPSPLEVLLAVNAVLTLPFVVLGGLLLMPGRAQKKLALWGAWVSLLGSLLMIAGLQVAFDQWWAYQFSTEKQLAYRDFLSPVQVAMAMLPVLLGQGMQLYFASQVLTRERAAEVAGGADVPPQNQG